MQFQSVELVGDRACLSRQEAGADPVGLGAEPQIEACRLDLVAVERARTGKPTVAKQSAYVVVSQNAGVAHLRSPVLVDDTCNVVVDNKYKRRD